MPAKTFGFIGLGNMGGPMCGHIAALGTPLVAFDAAGAEGRLPDGATAAGSIAEVAAAADAVFLSLPDGKVVSAVTDEILSAPERRVATVADFSTTGPESAIATAARLAEAGIAYVDAPVSGGRSGAIKGTVTVICSGPEAAVTPLMDAFNAVGGNVFHVGSEPGQGQAVKLLNNFLSATAMAATSEAVLFGENYGIEMRAILDVVNVSSGQNTASADKFPNRIATGTFDAGFSTTLMTKDVSLFLDQVRRAGTSDAIASAMASLWQAADAEMPGSDFTEIYRYVAGSRAQR